MATKNKPNNPLPNGYVSKGEGGSHGGSEGAQANYIPKDPRAMHVRVHINNEGFEPGKKITVQKSKVKTFEKFLEECTEKLNPAFGCARRLYTSHGRHRIQDLDDLQEDNVYVITGFEGFKKLK